MWPQSTDYNDAIQTPTVSFQDPELKEGKAAAGGLFGAPLSYTGNFAIVYKMDAADGEESWAVKCFTREVRGLHERYQAISEHLERNSRPFMVEFKYLEEGIRVRGDWFPVVKMRWVEGYTLDAFLRAYLDRLHLLDELATIWVKLARQLREAGMAHGDLQHSNVMLVPSDRVRGPRNDNNKDTLALRLIDYDGMYVPALANQPSAEKGHSNFQHPYRLEHGGYGPEVDRFSHLLIYTAFKCLRAAGKELWERRDDRESLLFRKTDLDRPHESAFLSEMWALPDPQVHALLGHLLLALRQPPNEVPLLDDLLEPSGPRPLSAGEEAEVARLLAGKPLPRKTRLLSLASVPPQPPPASPDVFPLLPLADEPPRDANPASSPLPYSILPVLVENEVVPAEGPSKRTSSVAEVVLDALPASDAEVRGGNETELTPSPLSTLIPELSWEAIRRWDVRQMVQRWPFWVGVGGGFLTVTLIFLFTSLLILLCWPSRQPSPAPLLPQLLNLGPIIVTGGKQVHVPVEVNRREWRGPLILAIRNLPEAELTTEPLTLPPGQTSIRLPLEAPFAARAGKYEAVVQVWAGDTKTDEKKLTVTLQACPIPRFLDSPELVTIPQGGNREVFLRIERRGCDEPLRLELDVLPSGVTQRSSVARGQTETIRLDLSADRTARGAELAWLILKVADRNLSGDASVPHTPWLGRKRIRVAVQPSRAPRPTVQLIPSIDTLVLQEGQARTIAVDVKRKEDQKGFTLEAVDLPGGVTCAAVPVLENQGLALLTLIAEEGIRPGTTPIKFQGVRDGSTLGECSLQLTLVRPLSSAPGQPTLAPSHAVNFRTGDRVILGGTLYAGAKGRNGACILMLSDLNRTQEDASWIRLARSLQGQGHTVLTFDYRGMGRSTRVEPSFWLTKSSLALLGAFPEQQADQIDASTFPASYLPWLVQDVMAARHYLDQLHEAGKVNSHNLVVIGAGKGALLGSLWLAWESRRHQILQSAPVIRFREKPEVDDVLGTAWVGFNPSLGKPGTINRDLYAWVALTGKQGIPQAFVNGTRDRSVTRLVSNLVKRGWAGRAEQVKFSIVKDIPESNLVGQDLIQDERASKWVVEHVAGLIAERGNREWKPRPGQKAGYCWAPGNGARTVAIDPFTATLRPLDVADPLKIR
jgi:hypothetical protein